MLDIERIILRALENHEMSLAQRERQLEEYTNLKSEQMIKAIERLYRFERKLKLRAVELFSHVPDAEAPVLPSYVDDWDWMDAHHALVSTDYVSPPSCLELHGGDEFALCNYSPTLNIPDGRIIVYIKSQEWWGTGYVSHPKFMFRNQTPEYNPVDDPINVDGYWCEFAFVDKLIALRRKNVGLGNLQNITTPNITAWSQFRITWFSSENGFEVHFEYFDGSEWQMYGALVDPDDYYKTSSVNRVGFGMRNRGDWLRFDDMEIWSV